MNYPRYGTYSDDPPWRMIGLIVAGVLFLSLGIYQLVTYRKDVSEKVVGISWSRTIDIQTWMTVQENGWDVPAAGREIRNYRAIHHYDHVWVGSHQDCTWSGTGDNRRQSCTTVNEYDDVPVYRTKYDYWIERWITTKRPELHGTDHEAKWPDVSDIRTHDVLQIGDERVGTHYSRYTVVFTHDYALDITEERWRNLNIGDKRTVVVNIFNQAMNFKEGWS